MRFVLLLLLFLALPLAVTQGAAAEGGSCITTNASGGVTVNLDHCAGGTLVQEWVAACSLVPCRVDVGP